MIIAHRGAMTEAPENTRPAFDKAVACGVDGIEFDVQVSRDGFPVIYHDSSLVRIAGRRKFLSDFTFQELNGLDWGGWFSEAFRNEKILTLDEMLTTYGPKTRLMIEIKPPPKKRYNPLYQNLAETVVASVKKLIPRDRMSDMFVLSFDPVLIQTAYQCQPGLNYVLNVDSASMDPDALKIDLKILSGVCINRRKLTRRFVEAAHQRDKLIMTYSCNSEKTLNHALALGVDGIMTDDPGSPMWRKRGLPSRAIHE